jgi:hypothetical protein
MLEMMVRSTYSVNNMHGIVNDNSNPYMTMVMDAMRINQSHVTQCPIVDEKLIQTRLGFLIF